MSQSIPGKPVFPAQPRLSSRGSTHTTVGRGTALWESLVGKPRGKAPDPLIHAKGSATLFLQLGRKAHMHAPTRDEDFLPWGDSRSPPSSMSDLERNPQVPATTPHKERTRHRRERNPERPPSNSHGDWPFLRPPERVPEVPVVSREHLPQLEKIQEVLPSRRDEAHFR